MAKAKSANIIPIERIASRIYVIRGEKVMFDFDLAELYGVPTKRLNEQVTRNAERFPEDFMFRLNREETEALNRSQIATGSQKHRDPRYPPRAFTEQGVAMLSSILRSGRAAEINVLIMRTYVQLRKAIASNEELARKVAEHDQHIANLYEQVEWLLNPPDLKTQRSIGFVHPKEDEDGD